LGAQVQQPAGTFLVGIYDGAARDEILFFDPIKGTLPELPGPGAGVLFANDVPQLGNCNIDNVSSENGYRDDGQAEVWFSCNGGGLYQARVADFQNNVEPVSGAAGADLIVAFNADPFNPNVSQRRVFARRGESTLIIEREEPNVVDATTNRLRDTFAAGIEFGAIADIIKIADADQNEDLGDLILVFDRASPMTDGKPALIPLERSTAGEGLVWNLPGTVRPGWEVVTLPETTHFVRIGDIPDPLNLVIDDVDATIANLTVFEPTEARVSFGRLEEIMRSATKTFDPVESSFNLLLLERGDRPTAIPSAEDRVFLVDVPSTPNAVFYVLSDQLLGWKMTLHRTIEDDNSNDVRAAVFNRGGSNNRVVGALNFGADTDEIWIAITGGGLDEIHRVKFDQ
jgi:hypothetical protein